MPGQNSLISSRYQIGDAFVYLRQSEVMERLEQDQGKIGTLVDETETKITEITEEMDKLKKVLYSKFGNAINLER